MRTTLDIEDDVLLAAKEIARRQKTSVGAMISDLARRLLTQRPQGSATWQGKHRSRLAALGIQPPRLGQFQLTDLYLLALAIAHQGCFVTFDARIPLNAVRGAKPEHRVSI